MANNVFRALALQVACASVNRAKNRTAARSQMQQTIERLASQITASLAFIGPDCRLVLLPEYLLTGFPMGESLEEWGEKACLEMDDPIYGALGQIAQTHNIFLAGNAYERDPEFPDLYFQTCFAIDPTGAIVLRYRRLNSMFAPTPPRCLGSLSRLLRPEGGVSRSQNRDWQFGRCGLR